MVEKARLSWMVEAKKFDEERVLRRARGCNPDAMALQGGAGERTLRSDAGTR